MKFNLLKFSFFWILIFFGCGSIFSSSYYADIKIYIENDGSISILGDTNYEMFQNVNFSEDFTSKKRGVWTFNLSSEKNVSFDEFIFELVLPKNSQITYIKTTPTFRIENEGEKIKIIGTGKSKPFTLIVQYKIKKQFFNTASNFIDEKFWFVFSLIFLILIIIYLLFMIYSLKKMPFEKIKKRDGREKRQFKNEESKNDKVILDLNKFTKRQQDIILILKEKGKITQKELFELMDIPKSSVSRNVKTLVVKQVIKKDSVGVTNYLYLSEDIDIEK